ncbi:hypothetical protein L249_7026 [Ophiocordyceps polyrhachis-furcata BCC 54312]|uniref:Uncharacterized protein n=1 Tax=Ophiocordyceps polyrhachis-furcata BCC 54312 TaxID=1330021 RepID=A0A367LKL1_9HYPO|nr:hypothetical protein L249_7026 [Ophiocordyceps polyrhachis-furcata BCC 54312]
MEEEEEEDKEKRKDIEGVSIKSDDNMMVACLLHTYGMICYDLSGNAGSRSRDEPPRLPDGDVDPEHLLDLPPAWGLRQAGADDEHPLPLWRTLLSRADLGIRLLD